MKMYYDADADLGILRARKSAIIGFGSQGHAQALNLRDSGVDVVVSEVPGTPNFELAVKYGFKPVSAAEAAAAAQVVQILAPDHIQAAIYEQDLKPHMQAGKTLLFSHGFNIHYGQIVPGPQGGRDHGGPQGPGPPGAERIRERRRRPLPGGGGAGPPRVRPWPRPWPMPRASAPPGPGCSETTFREETETDLFGEQAVLCGGVSELVKAGFDTLVEAGYAPEIAYFECFHELKLIVDLFYQGGLEYMRYSVSDTAEYGDYTRGPRIITEETRDEMRQILYEVQSGEFAKEWILENQARRPVFNALRRQEAEHPIEEVGKKLRAMMGWLKK